MPVIGSRAWVARSCGPDISYRVFFLQTACKAPTAMHLQEANKVVRCVKGTFEMRFMYKSRLDWNTCVLAVVGDASHANDWEYLEECGVMQPYRSQGVRSIFEAEAQIRSEERSRVHVLSFSSTVIRRLCKSTVQPETYDLHNCAESADIVRAAIVDAQGLLDQLRWEKWFTDCRWTYDALQKPAQAKMQDKRRSPGGGRADPRATES